MGLEERIRRLEDWALMRVFRLEARQLASELDMDEDEIFTMALNLISRRRELLSSGHLSVEVDSTMDRETEEGVR